VDAFIEEHMKKSLIALSISSALLTSISGFATQATNTNTNAIEQTEVVTVTANRTLEDKFTALAAVDVFTHDDIVQIQPLSVTDLLNRVAGVSVSKSGGEAHQTSVFVRGSSSGQVLVLVNGVRVGSATLGGKDLASIPVQLVERIEIVRGPRAALWGADAMGGVIQIFTRKLNAGEAQVGAKFGTHQYKQGYAAVGLGNEQHQYTLSANIEASNGFDVIKPNANSWTVNQPDNDGYDRQSIALVGLSQFSDIYSLESNAQFDQGTTEFDNSWGGDETTINNHNLLLRGHATLKYANFQLSVANSKDHNKDNQAKLDPTKSAAIFETVRNQITGLAQYALSTQSDIQLGGEWYNEKVSSSVSYAELERNANAIFVTARQQLSAFKLEASVRRDAISGVDAKNTYQLGAGYQINDSVFVALNHGTAFKAPTFNELYYPYSGNPNLKPEEAKNTEFLTRYQRNDFSAELSVFRSDYTNMIIWEPDQTGSWSPLNVSPLMKGVEATFSADLLGLQHHLTVSHIDAENDQVHAQLLRIPYFSANYSVYYQADKWDLNAELNYQGGRFDIDGSQRIRLASNTLINLSASYFISPKLTLLGKINNLANKTYQQINEHPGDDRTISIGIDYRF
jgi:vitamin B12 transporter